MGNAFPQVRAGAAHVGCAAPSASTCGNDKILGLSWGRLRRLVSTPAPLPTTAAAVFVGIYGRLMFDLLGWLWLGELGGVDWVWRLYISRAVIKLGHERDCDGGRGMAELSIPDEAVRRAAHWMKVRQGPDASEDYWRSEMSALLPYVAPLIVAAELERIANEEHEDFWVDSLNDHIEAVDRGKLVDRASGLRR